MITALVKKPFATRIDEQILGALSEAADQKGVSIAKYLEQLLIHNLKIAGTLPDDFKPQKTNWGGRRSGAGKPKSTTDHASDDRTSDDA